MILVVAIAPLAAASSTLIHAQSSTSLDPVVEVEVPFGELAAGSTVGANATNASASVSGTLSLTTTEFLYLNNTNASGTYHAKLELIDSQDIGILDTLEVGIDNGTRTDQMVVDGGSVTRSSGPYVELGADSTNMLYVRTSLSSLTTTPKLWWWAYAADDADGSAYVKSYGVLTVDT
jgi:hypothetical protein